MEENRWRGGPLELYVDERGVQTGASLEVGDEDELTAHGPGGDGSIHLAGGDGETLIAPRRDAEDDAYDLEEWDDTDDFWWRSDVRPS